jgi:hypothetical protein
MVLGQEWGYLFVSGMRGCLSVWWNVYLERSESGILLWLSGLRNERGSCKSVGTHADEIQKVRTHGSACLGMHGSVLPVDSHPGRDVDIHLIFFIRGAVLILCWRLTSVGPRAATTNDDRSQDVPVMLQKTRCDKRIIATQGWCCYVANW